MNTGPPQAPLPPQAPYPQQQPPGQMAYPPQPGQPGQLGQPGQPGFPPQGYPPQGYPPQGYPPQGYPPQGYPPQGHPGYQAVPLLYPVMAVPASGIELMKMLKGVYLKQKVDAIEAFVAYEKANKYKFFPIDQNGNKAGNAIFKAKEKSNDFARQFMGPGRAFDMTIKMLSGDHEIMDFMHLQREGLCCRCDKGEMIVSLLEGGLRNIGFIYGPCTCCQLLLNILDVNRNVRYSLKGDACQCGLICGGCPCEDCRIVRFTLNDAAGNIISTMERRVKFATALISDADEFSLIFPAGISVEDKCLLMASLIMMDFAYFERGPNNNNNIGSD